MDPVATLSISLSRYISLLHYSILRSSVLSRPLRQRHAYSTYCNHQREPNEKLTKRLATVLSPSQIALQGVYRGKAEPNLGLVWQLVDGPYWTNWSHTFCLYVAMRMFVPVVRNTQAYP
jgi:hypothetical protein